MKSHYKVYIKKFFMRHWIKSFAPDDFHNIWNFRLAVIPVMPNPFSN